MSISLDGNLGIVSDGNVTTNSYFIGNGAYLTGIQVSSAVPGSNILIDPTGNAAINIAGNTVMAVSSLGASVAGNVYASGNVVSNNVSSNTVTATNITGDTVQANIVSSTGNVVAGNLVLSNTPTPGMIVFPDGTTQSTAATAYTDMDVAFFLASGTDGSDIITTGNVSGSYVLGNGAFLTGITGGGGTNYTDANVAAYLASGNAVTVDFIAGNIIPGANNLSLGSSTNPWKDLWVSSSTIYINQIPLSGGAGNTLTYNNQPIVVASNTATPVASNIATTANIIASNVVIDNLIPGGAITFADGTRQDTAAIPYSNANVSALLPVYSGNANANIITANLFTTSNATITNAVVTNARVTNLVTSTLQYAAMNGGPGNLAISGNVISTTGNTITIDPRGDGGSGGTLNVLGNVVVTGNLTYNDVGTAITSNLVWQAANTANTAVLASGGGLAVGPAGNSYASWTYNQPGNIWLGSLGANFNGAVTATRFIGSGNTLSNIQGANVSGYVGFAGNANVATVALTAYSVSGANVSGTVGNAVHANVADLANIASVAYSVVGSNVSGQVANALVAGTVYTAAQPNITSLGILTTLSTNGNISAIGNISAGGNVSALGNISAAGNVRGAYILGDGGLLTNVQVGAGTAIVNGSSNVTVALNGNVTVGVAGTPAVVTVSQSSANVAGNVAANYFVGNGAFLTGIAPSSNYGNANAAAFLASGNLNTSVITSANVSGAFIFGNGVGLSSVNGANVTGYVPNATNANVAAVANAAITVAGANVTGAVSSANVAQTVSNAAQPTITSLGNLTALSASGNISTTGNVVGATITTGGLSLNGNTLSSNASVITIDPRGDGASQGTLNVLGNVVVTGNLTYNDIGTTTTSNLVWQAANSASSNTLATGGGLAVGPAGNSYASWLYNQSNNAWVSNLGASFNGNLNTTGVINGNGMGITGVYRLNNSNANLTLYANNAVTVTNNTSRYVILDGSNVALGADAGGGGNFGSGSSTTIAIGMMAGYQNQGPRTIAIGESAGFVSQGANAIAIGTSAGATQGTLCIGIGMGVHRQYPGANNSVANAIAIGTRAGDTFQRNNAIAIGTMAGYMNQGPNSIAIGAYAGNNNQIDNSIILNASGAIQDATNSGFYVNPIRQDWGNTAQTVYYNPATKELTYLFTGSGVTAITNGSSQVNIPAANGNITMSVGGVQSMNLTTTSVAIGQFAGRGNVIASNTAQAANAVAIGANAGYLSQGANSVALGAMAGFTSQANNSIAINATGANLSPTASGFYVAPIRNDIANITNTVYYNTTTKELTYGPAGGGGNSNVIPNTIVNGTSNVLIAGANSNITMGVNGNVVMTVSQSALAWGTQSRAGANSISLGYQAGKGTQGLYAIAIGDQAAWQSAQGIGAIAIGVTAGAKAQGDRGIAIGDEAAREDQGASAIAIGFDSGVFSQGAYSISIGENAGTYSQTSNSIAIGAAAGMLNQGLHSIAMGSGAGSQNQGADSIAIGYNSGNNQNTQTIAIGTDTGSYSQLDGSIAIGYQAGNSQQKYYATAVGYKAGYNFQGNNAVAFGRFAGGQVQGANSVAIGAYAGNNSQTAGSIAINASGVALDPTTAGLYINPVRRDTTNTANIVYFNAATKELTYAPTLTGIANGTSSVNIANANGAITMAVGGASAMNLDTQSVSLGAGSAAASYLGVAIGPNAGAVGDQGQQAVAVGSGAGEQAQGTWSVAVGADSGTVNQGQSAVALGYRSGYLAQGSGAVAIGFRAGEGQIFAGNQGANSIAIGMYAGANSAATNSIILNASGSVLNSTNSGFYANPVRNDATNATSLVSYNTSTKELTYSTTVANATTSSSANSVGYLGLPQNSQGANYTAVIGDAGKHIYLSAAVTATIPANSSVAYPIGTALTFVTAASPCTIAINTDSLVLAGQGTTGSRTLSAYGLATAVKVAATTWYINGVGLS